MKIQYLLVLLFLYSCKGNQAPQSAVLPSYPVLSITTGNVTTEQEYPASIQGAVNVEIRPQISGILSRLYVEEGGFVNAGQPLFKIDDAPFREKLNNAKASLHSAEGALANAQLQVDKLTPLVQNKVISDYQLREAQTARQIAQANMEQAKSEISSASINLGYTLIKAPVSGYIGRLDKKQGSLVGPADAAALTDLSDVHNVHVYFALGEQDFVNFKSAYAGNTLDEKIRHLPLVDLVLANDSLFSQKGKVDLVDGQFDKTTGAITFRASFPNKGGLLRSGNTGRIRLGLIHQGTLIVPQNATVELQDKIFVFLLADSNKVRKQAISVVGKSGPNYLVKDGIKPGDRIVTDGLGSLQEGTIIHPDESVKTAAIKN